MEHYIYLPRLRLLLLASRGVLCVLKRLNQSLAPRLKRKLLLYRSPLEANRGAPTGPTFFNPLNIRPINDHRIKNSIKKCLLSDGPNGLQSLGPGRSEEPPVRCGGASIGL